MPSAIEIMQWVYSQADPGHVDELFSCNEMTLAVIVASPAGDVRFQHDAVGDVLALNRSEELTGSPARLARDGALYRAASAAFANSQLQEARSVLSRLPASDRGEWLVVACCGEFDGETSAFLLVGRTEPRPDHRGPWRDGRDRRRSGHLPRVRHRRPGPGCTVPGSQRRAHSTGHGAAARR